ncbi:MAG TPA: tetratricopeptide repeat protein, partial [Armatimonadota bacterium]|nr:tetratricopeptide repeat protein [Armatimonadota bacterium]
MSTQEGGPEARTWLRVQVLLKEAKTERAQGRYRGAVAKCQEALELAPDSLEVLETLGDIHVGAGHFSAAMESYRKVLQRDPSRPGVEEKLARASLSQLGFQRQMDYGQRLLDRGAQADLKKASQIATSLSILFPGFGQLLNRHYWKALCMAAAHLCLILLGFHVVMDAVRQGQAEHRVEIRSAPRSPYQRQPTMT